MAPKKKKPKLPKIRRTWGINPKARVVPSKKTYQKKKERQKNRQLDLFEEN